MIDPRRSRQPILADDLRIEMKRGTGLMPCFIRDVGPRRAHGVPPSLRSQSERSPLGTADPMTIRRRRSKFQRECSPQLRVRTGVRPTPLNETVDVQLPPQRHGRARMGAFLSIGRGVFFRSSRRGVLRLARRPVPGLRSLGQREMSVSGALSRPKPPEAGAEGQPLQGFAHRRPSPGEIEGPRGCPSAAPFFDPRRRLVEARRTFPTAKTALSSA